MAKVLMVRNESGPDRIDFSEPQMARPATQFGSPPSVTILHNRGFKVVRTKKQLEKYWTASTHMSLVRKTCAETIFLEREVGGDEGESM